MALILKDFTGLTDDEILEECECDLRYQYALHTTNFEDQPLSDRTFSRFRERCAAYELTTGGDLIHTCFVSLADEIRTFMDIAPNIKRMDSMMIESNIRKMGRLELLERAIREQTNPGGGGHHIPKTKDDDMDSSVLQNPSDPDATYRKKAGKEHRGYVANITETVGKNGSVITDYQYDVNTRSDAAS